MFQKLSTRIIASVVAGGAVIVVLLTALHMIMAERDTRELAGRQLHALVARAADDINARMANRIKSLTAAAQSLGPADALTEASAEQFLSNQAVLATQFDGLIVSDRSGRVLGDRPSVPGRRGLSVTDRDYFIKARDTLKPYVSSPFLSKVGNKPTVNFAVPMLDAQGRFGGVLSGTLEVLSNDFVNEIRNAKIGESGYFVVLTRNTGVTVIHPQASSMLKPIPTREQNALLHRAVDGWNGWGEGTISDGSTALLAYEDLASANWLVGGILPTREAYASLHQTARWVAAAGVGATVVLSLLVWIVIASSLAPLNRLREQMDDLRAGRRNTAVDPSGPEEVRRLAIAFTDLEHRRASVEAELRNKEDFHRTLNESSPLGIFVIGEGGHCSYANGCYEQLVGRSFAELSGRGWTKVLHPEDIERVEREWNEAMRLGDTFDSEHRYRRPDGQTLWVHMRAKAMHGADGPHDHLAVVSDITLQRHARDELKQERARAEAIVDAFQDSMLVLDAKGDVRDLSPAAEKLTGWPRQRVAGMPLNRVLLLQDEETAEEIPLETFFSAERFSSDRWVVLEPSGLRRAMDVTWVRRQLRDGLDIGGILMLRDAVEAREAQRRLSWEAAHDSLTGLMNRRGFTQALGDAWAQYRKTRLDSALLMIDLDGFKQVNDIGGHAAGDEMLRKVAHAIESTARATDCAARLGGDEFTLLLPGCTPERALAIGASLQAAVKALVVTRGDASMRISASVGCSRFLPADSGFEAMVQRADAACYRVKSGGRDGVDGEWALSKLGPVI
jgi:diguanylate cyclase (GGDEF)-like protein/PAS domain S-box-containing protein